MAAKKLDLTEVIRGRVVRLCSTYGFIAVEGIAQNVFFHRKAGVNNSHLLPTIGEEITFFVEIDARGRYNAWLWAASSVLPPEDELTELMGASISLEQDDLLFYSGSMHYDNSLTKGSLPSALWCGTRRA